MENQHQKITGYRSLSQEEIDLMNEIKALGNSYGALLDRLAAVEGLDKRAVALAKTKGQESFMWATRAVAQPTTFC